MIELSWEKLFSAVDNLSRDLDKQVTTRVYGIPTGGSFVALLLRQYGFRTLDHPEPGCYVVDDIIDSGQTISKYCKEHSCYALFHKKTTPGSFMLGQEEIDCWIKFPWEHSAAPEDAVTRILEYIGEDPRRDGLRDTPQRVLRSLKEMTAGYQQDPKKILERTFELEHDQMIVLSGIRFTSLCEHHMLPFSGTASVGYIPKIQQMHVGGGGESSRVVGISKLARLVTCFARRLQTQERLTDQVARSLDEEVSCLGVGVILKASHSCMGCRGVLQPDAELVTSRLLGRMEQTEARSEFLRLAGF